MTHRKHFSLTAIAVVLFTALTATLGFAQPKAESGSGTTPPSAAAPATAPAVEAGVLVVAVQPGSPAETAGIKRGDIILEANGVKVNDARQLRQAVADRAAGDKLSVKLRHGDAEKTLSVTVGTQDGRAWIGVLPLPGRGPGMMDDQDFGLGMRGYGPGMRGYGPGERGGGPGRQGPDGFGPMFRAEGALVESVAAGSPAEKAGLKKGDLILSVDGTTVDERNPLADLVSAKKAGDTITLSVTSWGRENTRDVKATLAKQQDKDAPYLGVQYMPAPRRFGEEPGPGLMAGAVVVDVASDSPAAKAGIQPRDVIAKIDGVPVTAPQQVVDAVAKHKPGEAVAITLVQRPGASQTELTVTLGANPNDAAKAWLGLSMGGGPGFPGMRGLPRTPPSAPGANTPTL